MPANKAGGKRGADEGADGPVKKKRKRRAASPRASLSEEQEDPAAELERQRVLRAFWSQWSSPMLRAWVLDWLRALELPDEEGAIETRTREQLLSTLVTDERFRPPKESVAGAELIKAYERVRGPYDEKAVPLREGVQPADASEGEESDLDLSSEDEEDDGADDSSSQNSTPQKGDRSPNGGLTPRKLFGPAAPPRCQCCGEVAPQGTPEKGPWKCGGCGLRGDLAMGSEENRELRQMAKERAATAAPVERAAAAPASQETHAHKATLSKRDAEFVRMAQEGAAFPLFANLALPTEECAEGTQRALARMRCALNSKSYARPSEALVTLIQAGKLREIGYALPRRVGEDDTEAERPFIGEDGRVQARSKAAAPRLRSASEFATALCGTILPALYGRGEAQMEWCALAVTLMEIERKSGWVAASEYLRLLLADRVPTGQPLAEADEPLVFALERQALATPGA